MLWIVGHAFRDIREYLHSHDIPYGVLTNHSRPVSAVLAGVRTVPLDFTSAESLVRTADAANLDITAVTSAGYENYVLPAAILAEHYHLPGLSIAAAKATTDKALMRAKFQAYNPAITPDFRVIETWQDAERFIERHNFPVMLKPTNLMKSLYITKNNSLSELQAHHQELVTNLQTIRNKVYTLDQPEIIIEECMTGSMHTVAGYVDASGEPHLLPQIADCITGIDIGQGENYLYSRQLPSALPPSIGGNVLAVAAEGVRALGLTNTMLHIELMLTTDGPKIIEIGARIGGYRTRMYEYAAGVDMNAMLIDVAYGKAPSLQTGAERNIAVLELFPDTEGRFDTITGLEGLQALPSLRYVKIKPVTGQPIGRSSHGFKAAAIVILGHEEPARFAQDLAYIRKNVTVTVQDRTAAR